MNNLYFLTCSVMISLLICIVFFTKKRIKSDETKAYSYLIIFSLLESISAFVIVVLTNLFGVESYLYVMHRFDYALILFWVWALFNYVLTISFLNFKDKLKKIQLITILVNMIVIVMIFFSELNVINEHGVIDTYGSATNIVYSVCALYVLVIAGITVISLIKDIKNSNNKKYLPLLSLVILAVGMLIIRSIYPEIILISYIAAFSNLIMFFTIENPDVKMIYELNKNKKLLEDSNTEKANFLFDMSQEVKKPVDNISEAINKIKASGTNEDIVQGIKVIDNNARNLRVIVNNVLDISSMDSSNLIVSKDTYNIANLLETIKKRIANDVSKEVELRSTISKSLPKEVYGDSVKLKQVIMTILLNSCKYTKEGFIELRVNEIVKYGVCRLVIEIEDSGQGMSIETINELLKDSSELQPADLRKLNSLDMDLKVAFRVIKLLGGFISIKSEENKGSSFTIILDQKISEEDVILKKYDKYIFNNKKVLVVSNDKEILRQITALSKKYNIDLLHSLYGKDCIERINNKEQFDLILLEDELKPDSAYMVLKELQSLKGFKAPVLVMLDNDKKSIKEHYIADGFDNYVIKEKIEEEFDKVIKKYI